MRKVWTGFVLGLLLVAGCDRGSHPSNIGKPAPQFVISDSDHTVNLSQLRGHVVLLNLWATWCVPCQEELPSLIALHKQMPNIDIVAISMDSDPDLYHQFLTQNHVDFTTIRDETGRINALYGTAKIPETYIIDRHGILRRKFIDSQNWTSPDIVKYLASL